MDKRGGSDLAFSSRDGGIAAAAKHLARLSAKDEVVARLLAPIRQCLERLSADGAPQTPPQLGIRLLPHEVERYYAENGSYVASRALHAATGGRQGALIPSSGRGMQAPHSAFMLHSPRFKTERITKGSSAARKLQRTARPLGTAEKHQRYIERADQSAKRIDPNGVLLIPGPRATGTAGAELGIQQERAHRSEQDVIAVRGNLAPSLEQRCQLWRDLELLERENRGLILKLDPRANRDFWEEICGLPGCPDEIGVMRGRKKVKRIAISDERLEEIMQWLRLQEFDCQRTQRWRPNCRGPGRRGTRVPALVLRDRSGALVKDALELSVGRGGTIMWKIEVALPYELETSRAIELIDGFVAEIQRFEVPVCAVIHACPKHGDKRNLHGHITFPPRPAKLESDGRWDFQHQADIKRLNPQASLSLQKKVAAFRSDDFPQRMRAKLVELANAALEQAGIGTRWIPGTFKDAGILREARISPTHSAYYQESRGKISPRGRRAAAQFATSNIRSIERKFHASLSKARALVDAIQLDRTTKQVPLFRALRSAASEYLRLARTCAQYDRQLSLYNLLLSAHDSSALSAKYVERKLLRAPDHEAVARLRLELDQERAVDQKIRSIGVALASAGEAFSKVRRRRDMLESELEQLPSIPEIIDAFSAALTVVPAPPPGLHSFASGAGPEAEVLGLIQEAQSVLQSTGPRRGLHRARIARHWTGNNRARAYLAQVLNCTAAGEEKRDIWTLLHVWGELALPASLPRPQPVSEAEFRKLEGFFGGRRPEGFGSSPQEDGNWAADVSYRLLHHLDPLVTAGYLRTVLEIAPADPQDAVRQIVRIFPPTAGAHEFALGWFDSVEAGERRAISHAVGMKVAAKAAFSGLDATGGEMFARLIWIQEFHGLFGGADHIPGHLRHRTFGPSGSEVRVASEFFRSRPDASKILQAIAPDVWHSVNQWGSVAGPHEGTPTR